MSSKTLGYFLISSKLYSTAVSPSKTQSNTKFKQSSRDCSPTMPKTNSIWNWEHNWRLSYIKAPVWEFPKCFKNILSAVQPKSTAFFFKSSNSTMRSDNLRMWKWSKRQSSLKSGFFRRIFIKKQSSKILQSIIIWAI